MRRAASTAEQERPTDNWRSLKRRAAERVDALVERALRDAANRAWGRGLFGPRWQLVKDLDEAWWRAYHYVGSAGPDDHRYLELGVVCHLDPAGNLIGFGVDNGADFIGLHDTSEYGLRRGLEHIRKQRPKVQVHQRPTYEHKIRAMSDER